MFFHINHVVLICTIGLPSVHREEILRQMLKIARKRRPSILSQEMIRRPGRVVLMEGIGRLIYRYENFLN